MASIRILSRLFAAGTIGVSACYIYIKHTNSSPVYALSYGRHVYGEDKRTHWDTNWDHRDPRQSDGSKEDPPLSSDIKLPTATRHLILIRHGQYVTDATDPDKKILTELGRQQAEVTGKRLNELNIPLSVLHHSTMIRAVQTAQIIAQYIPEVPIKVTENLCEGAPIKPEPYVTHWKPEHWFFQDGSRIETAFRQFFHRATPEQKEDSYELIVCHANVIRYFVCRSLQLPPEAWLRMSIGNCGITRISIRPNGRVSLREMGGTGHLPPELITFN